MCRIYDSTLGRVGTERTSAPSRALVDSVVLYLTVFRISIHRTLPAPPRSPYYTKLRQPTKQCMYSRPSSCLSRRAPSRPPFSNQKVLPFPPFICIFFSAFGDRPVEPLSTRSRPISRVPLFSVNPSFLSLVVFSYLLPSLILEDISLSQRLSKLQSIWCSGANAGHLI